MKNQPVIWIVIPVHNRKKLTQACLQSLERQTNQRFKTIVVDDGSTDGTSQMIAIKYPEVILLHGDGNLWWTGAINKGIAHALKHCQPDDFILVLNDDLIVPTDYLENFLQLGVNNPKTCIGSVVTDINSPDVIASGGISINWLTAKMNNCNRGRNLSHFPKGHTVDVSTLTGRGVMFPSEVFRAHGLYNDRHYQQCGDTELPRRVKMRGYRLVVAYDVPVYSHLNRQIPSYRLKDLRKYFLNIRSNQNLKYRFWFAYDCSANFLSGTLYLLCDLSRILWHFLVRTARPDRGENVQPKFKNVQTLGRIP